MNLTDIYQEGGYTALKKLAEVTGSDPQYLRQIALKFKGGRKTARRPSPELAAKLIAADPRLTYEAMYSTDEAA